jgi:guanine deaminase
VWVNNSYIIAGGETKSGSIFLAQSYIFVCIFAEKFSLSIRFSGHIFVVLVVRLYAGFIINPLETPISAPQLEYIPDGCLIVDEHGVIQFVGTLTDAALRFSETQIQRFDNAVIMPGLVDTHVHLPQYQAAAVGTGELLDWLNTFIFPLEARFADEQYARLWSERFFRDALALGTTTMSVYCSSHKRATDLAFEAALQAGVRVCMGKTMMDFGAPDLLLNSPQQNIHDSLELAKRWHGADGGRLHYTLTPRFAGSCSSELLRLTGEVARAESFRIQTHLSENPSELHYIASLFPEAESYTDVYDRAGMLTEQTIMAHSIYLSQRERSTLRDHNCAIAHCPCSNRFLQSGVMPLRKTMMEGFRVGLGSDVAGGISLSMLNEAKEAAESSKTWNILHRGRDFGRESEPELPPVSAEEALWLATLGGAQALGLERTTGNFKVGKEADFVVVSLEQLMPRETLFSSYSNLVARLVYGMAGMRVEQTFVRGREVYTRR